MIRSCYLRVLVAAILSGFLLGGCATPSRIAEKQPGSFHASNANAKALVAGMPDYRASLTTLKGKGKAIVSEPGRTDRVTLHFFSNRHKSLVKINNTLGIEGGQLLTDGDTLLVYNKVDKYAQKIPVQAGKISSINNLASLNILKMLNFTTSATRVQSVLENPDLYQLQLDSGAKVFLNRKDSTVREVQQPASSGLPYSRIQYDAYGNLQGFLLPRRITIFSADKKSKIALLIQDLEMNPDLGTLKIDLPDNIRVYTE